MKANLGHLFHPPFPITLLVLLLTGQNLIATNSVATTPMFRFSTSHEPSNLDPAQLGAGDSGYLISTVYSGLYKYQNNEVRPLGAKKCTVISSLKMICELNPKIKWSDSTVVKAQEYVDSFRRIVSPEYKNKEAGLLLSLKNAKEIIQGKIKSDTLGVKAKSDFELEFMFASQDPDFLYKLSHPLLVPVKSLKAKASDNVFNGPYIVSEWSSTKKIVLTPNPHYPFGNPKRPNVEVLFVDEDTTAIKLFEKGDLSFVRRLPSILVKTYKNNPSFFQQPVVRFDHIGFADKLTDQPNLRKAIVHAIDYEGFLKAFDSISRPGCPSFPNRFFKNNQPICYNFDLKKAKEYLEKVPKESREMKIQMGFSKLGGDDIQRTAEWLQQELKKNLGLQIEITSYEQGVYLNLLSKSPPSLFRKGVALHSPTCRTALETISTGHPENFIGYQNKDFEKTLVLLAKSKSEKEKQKLCTKAYQIMISNYVLIPLGQFSFSMLRDLHFKNWTLNDMNQLDLSNLTYQP